MTSIIFFHTDLQNQSDMAEKSNYNVPIMQIIQAAFQSVINQSIDQY